MYQIKSGAAGGWHVYRDFAAEGLIGYQWESPRIASRAKADRLARLMNQGLQFTEGWSLINSGNAPQEQDR